MKTTVSIPGMHCASCVALIKEVSEEVPGITAAIDIEKKTVELDHPDDFDFEAWKIEIESLDPRYKVQRV